MKFSACSNSEVLIKGHILFMYLAGILAGNGLYPYFSPKKHTNAGPKLQLLLIK